MIKYRAITWSSNTISQVEIERESDKTVWYKSQSGTVMRDRKNTDSTGYFDSWEEAKDFLLKKADNEVQKARRNLEYYQDKYGNVKGLKQLIKGEEK